MVTSLSDDGNKLLSKFSGADNYIIKNDDLRDNIIKEVELWLKKEKK